MIRHRIVVAAALAGALLSMAPICARAYEVGFSSVTWQDPARGNRSIGTDLYYPATAAGQDTPVAAPPAGGFPVVAFGHGYLIGTSHYDYLGQSLAAAGYVVALPRTEGGLFPSHQALGLDLAFLPRRLRQAGQEPTSPFFGAIGATAALMGHSMGGGASFLGAASDPTVTALANLAAAETNPSAIAAAAQIGVPALLFSGGNDCVTPPSQHQIPMHVALVSRWKTRVTITGGSHCQFAAANTTCSLGEGGCPAPTISRAQQQQLVLQLLRPWLDLTLKGDAGAWDEFAALLDAQVGFSYEQSGWPTGVAEGDGGGDGPDGGEGALAAAAPGRPFLAPAHPNPSTGIASLRFRLPASGPARLDIFTLDGRHLRTLHDGAAAPGWHSVSWDGRDGSGRPAPAGVYLGRLRQGGAESVQRLLRLR